MTRDGLPGAAFGAAAVFLGAGVAGGAWPTGWAALVCALACGAVGATLLATRRGRAAAPEARDAVPEALGKTDAKPVRPGRSSLVAAALVWVLALLAGGVWALAAGDDDADGTRADTRPTAKPAASRHPRPAVAWTVPPAGQKYDEGVGSRGLGSAVAQGRIDGLFAYDGAEAEELVPDVVVAYSLKDGRKAWSYRAENQTMTLAAEPDGRVAVLENHDRGRILLLDRATGRVDARIEPDTAEGVALSIHPELVPVTGGHVVLDQILMQAEPAAFALR
ncbi:hypothetical protein EDD98_1117 [Streptomyces sp. PanSC19]|uniref:hypothetical protein n=1 Tax=Streptomyces sp. PanSC19 TaxID=1520455 RepID=UPI000F46F7C0|nr:hypothetical protein [Streptomyces sp. PanSC19]ROQ32143.1 hypothetical protein EDD98_1117 [Streptomyces sp. PanSC19]